MRRAPGGGGLTPEQHRVGVIVSGGGATQHAQVLRPGVVEGVGRARCNVHGIARADLELRIAQEGQAAPPRGHVIELFTAPVIVQHGMNGPGLQHTEVAPALQPGRSG